ncbi:MAG: DUF4124 domain-containing protein [Woeseiaceae bacterium]|nr:DUF4124 domain-containing protein [Woeseiaceae bacterium]
MRSRVICIGLSLTLSASPTFASEIFHWVDEDGIVNFSDWAPKNANVEVSKLQVRNSNPPGYDPHEDENSVLEQAERINDRWSDLQEQRDERRKQQQQAADRYQVPRYPEYDYPYYYRSGYYFPPIHRPGFGHPPPFRTKLRQAVLLDKLGLLERPRPHSINSSAHLARVNAGKSVSSGMRSAHSGRGHRREIGPGL